MRRIRFLLEMIAAIKAGKKTMTFRVGRKALGDYIVEETRVKVEGVGKMYYLTREIVERWREGLDKTWLNFRLEVPYVIGISGDYAYFVRVRNPREVFFERVPDFYKKCVNPRKKIYEYDAKLERIEKRELRKNMDTGVRIRILDANPVTNLEGYAHSFYEEEGFGSPEAFLDCLDKIYDEGRPSKGWTHVFEVIQNA